MIKSPSDFHSELKAAARKRERRLLTAGGSAIVGKGVFLLVNAGIIPITVRYLGAEQFGLWITITSTMTMLTVLDLGVANTLTGYISEAYAKDDRKLASHYFGTAFWMVTALALLIGLAGFTVGRFIPWNWLFQFHDGASAAPVEQSVAVAFVLFLVGLPAGLCGRILAGYQEMPVVNFVSGVGAALTFLLVALAVGAHGSLPLLVGAFSTGPVLANLGCLGWICLWHMPWMMPRASAVQPHHLGMIFHSGSRFFIIQLAGLIVFNSDNLVIAHFINAAQVTPYTITWRLASYGSSLPALLSPALWPAYSEAFARRDMIWIRRTYRRMQRSSAVILAVVAVALFFTGKTVIRIWAGDVAVPSTLLLGCMCFWMVMYGWTVNQACLMGATQRVGLQAVSSLLASFANLGLSIYLIRYLGVSGVILGSILSYVLFVVFVQSWVVRCILATPADSGASTGGVEP